MLLRATLERSYNTVPRAAARTGQVGPFTSFLKRSADRWDFYARPRLGPRPRFTAADVDAVRARQRELCVLENVEWVHDTTPSPAAGARRDDG